MTVTAGALDAASISRARCVVEAGLDEGRGIVCPTFLYCTVQAAGVCRPSLDRRANPEHSIYVMSIQPEARVERALPPSLRCLSPPRGEGRRRLAA